MAKKTKKRKTKRATKPRKSEAAPKAPVEPEAEPLAGSWLDPDARKAVADGMRELADDIEKGSVTRPEAIHRLGRLKLKLASMVDPNLFPTANPPPTTEPGDAQAT